LLRNPAPDLKKYKSLHSLISEFSCDPDVQKVSVNSTLSKRYIRDDDYLADYGEERETDDSEERETDDSEERETDDGEERETDDGEERETDDGEERETDDSEERETDDGDERETDDGEERETDDSEERETDDGEGREVDDGKERETDDSEERETDDGEERETDNGEERETDDSEERETDDSEERETDDSEERETDDGEERETDDGEERETDDGEEREPGYDTEGRLVDDEISHFPENRSQKEVGQKVGKAFIICNQHEDSRYGEDRKEALKNASTVLKEYFDFEVSSYNNFLAVAYQSVFKAASMILYIKTILKSILLFAKYVTG